MRDLVTSGVKTAVQVIVAAVVAWATRVGLDVDSQALETVLFGVGTGLVAVVLNWVGSRFPWVNTILSLGLTKQSATYTS